MVFFELIYPLFNFLDLDYCSVNFGSLIWPKVTSPWLRTKDSDKVWPTLNSPTSPFLPLKDYNCYFTKTNSRKSCRTLFFYVQSTTTILTLSLPRALRKKMFARWQSEKLS